MSPHAANSLVHDLVQMAQAMEQLPIVQAELDVEKQQVMRMAQSILDMGNDLEQSRTYAASLEQKVHTLEVARDDAELSFLEADERTSRALDFVKALFGNAGALIQALEPPKAAPQAEAPPKTETATLEQALTGQGWHEPVAAQLDSIAGDKRDVPPMSSASENVADHSFSVTSSNAEGTVVSEQESGSSVGQREPDPTMNVTHGEPKSEQTSATSSASGAVTSAESAPQPGPYAGKYYIDVPNFCTLSEWLAGGGTEFDYHYRPHSVIRY